MKKDIVAFIDFLSDWRFIETKELQKTVFKKQIGMALDMKKPLVIHCRDAEQDCLDILKQVSGKYLLTMEKEISNKGE